MKINLRDILFYSFWKVFKWMKCRKTLKRTQNQKKIALYKKGEEKIKQELDCVNLMTKLRQLDLLLSLYLNREQKFLLNLQKKHLIQDKETSDEEDMVD